MSGNCNLLPIDHGETLFFPIPVTMIANTFLITNTFYTVNTVCSQTWFVVVSLHVYNRMSEKHTPARGTHIFRSFDINLQNSSTT